MSRLSIRWRLTLWYGGVLAILLSAFGSGVFLLMREQLHRHAERSLSYQATAIETQVNRFLAAGWPLARLTPRLLSNPDSVIQIIGPDEQPLYRSERISDQGLPKPRKTLPLGAEVLEDVDVPRLGLYRMVSRKINSKGTQLLVQIATPLAANEHQLRALMAALLLAGSLALACALGGGYLLARQALTPVERMTAAADEITATRLDRRIEIRNPDDELGRLARTLNRMIERLERSFLEVRRFTADAAHELRTPLAILRNEAEVALRIPRDSEDYQVCLEDMLEEIDHLSNLIDALLILFREDAGQGMATKEELHLDELVREIAEHMRVVADQKHQELTHVSPPGVRVVGNPQQLRRLLICLLENAIKFTSDRGKIRLELEVSRNTVRLIVVDSGIGIAAEHLPRIFDRFYRVDAARSSRENGSGLGLSISRSIVEAHGGSIYVESEPGRGTKVVVSLPAGPSTLPRTASTTTKAAQPSRV